MIGLIIAPFRLAISLIATAVQLVSDGTWETLTTPGSDAYHPLWAPLLVLESAGNAVFMVTAIVLLVPFFSKHACFPRLMILYMTASLLFVSVDHAAIYLIPAAVAFAEGNPSKEVVRNALSAAIWIPYFLRSVRVKNTFVNGGLCRWL